MKHTHRLYKGANTCQKILIEEHGVAWAATVILTDGTDTWVCTFKKKDLANGKLLLVKPAKADGYSFFVEVKTPETR